MSSSNLSRLPPLNLKSLQQEQNRDDQPSSPVRQNFGSNPSMSGNGRDRRRRRLTSQLSNMSNEENNNRKVSIRNESLGNVNEAFDQDQEESQQPKQRRARRSKANSIVKELNEQEASKPSKKKAKKKRSLANNFISHADILQGLEEDIVEMEDETEVNKGEINFFYLFVFFLFFSTFQCMQVSHLAK